MQSLAISQITTKPLSIEQDLDLCRRLGCGLEIAESKLSTDYSKAKDQLAHIKESGIRITSIQPRKVAASGCIASAAVDTFFYITALCTTHRTHARFRMLSNHATSVSTVTD
ncbi:hypothetical protein IFT98_04970 [Pseudomonas sp. CFBP 8770]|uniref:hypothetical protein n=1 Tax=unclassified Pseudomonas TaxID=196821 RepID=UPI001780F98E|nr:MULTISPECIES: hypothetical protein [unclassified Pseudomonas]MBD8473211.1 hypothetical protein [Pseudomonas sp. CFBP 8773]MBD8646338.1 hypothetical protein [Pseudomonas sp. CFBP 8770]